jgi:catechol 2,3-dioxygenase-like lactoylglutathione lyase family enzyme
MAMEYAPENCVISVGVSDYDRSLAWYRDVLGFDLVYELKEYGWCELKTPFGLNIGLGQSETVAQGNITPTFGVRDIDAAIAELRGHDVKVEDWHEISGMVRLSTFWDPDGTPWMLAQTLDAKNGRADAAG